MDEEFYKKIQIMESKIDEIYKAMNAAKTMIKWSLIITVALFVIPLIILAFVLPSMMNTITSSYAGF
ncbi:MAG: hypothetical protein WCS88_03105 [Patescibacteria group bacterium]|jgi:hypothetical protein